MEEDEKILEINKNNFFLEIKKKKNFENIFFKFFENFEKSFLEFKKFHFEFEKTHLLKKNQIEIFLRKEVENFMKNLNKKEKKNLSKKISILKKKYFLTIKENFEKESIEELIEKFKIELLQIKKKNKF